MTRSVQQLFDLQGKTALVTGGSRGLGLQMAQALGEAGARVVLTSRKAADLEQAAEALQAQGIGYFRFAPQLPGQGACVAGFGALALSLGQAGVVAQGNGKAGLVGGEGIGCKHKYVQNNSDCMNVQLFGECAQVFSWCIH